MSEVFERVIADMRAVIDGLKQSLDDEKKAHAKTKEWANDEFFKRGDLAIAAMKLYYASAPKEGKSREAWLDLASDVRGQSVDAGYCYGCDRIDPFGDCQRD